MLRLVERDLNAFDELYHRHSRLVYGLCVRILRDEHEAEQVLIDVFFELWEKSERFNPDRANPRTYLVTLARSRAIDRWRKLRRSPRAVSPSGMLNLEGGDQPPDNVIHNEASKLVLEAFDHLSDDERHALENVYYQGMTHTEVAKAMGAPLGTVKTWIRRALKVVGQAVQNRYDQASDGKETNEIQQ